jgi:hypothetical protein
VGTVTPKSQGAMDNEIQSMFGNKFETWLIYYTVKRLWIVSGSSRRRRTHMEKYTLTNLDWWQKITLDPIGLTMRKLFHQWR